MLVLAYNNLPQFIFIFMQEFVSHQDTLFKVLASNGQDFELNSLIIDVAKACKKIAKAIGTAEIDNNMGNAANVNVQGEQQKVLDLITNKLFIESHQFNGLVAGVASEEMPDIVVFDKKYRKNAKYLVLFDPLDGSANASLNMTVGTIFSVLKFDGETPTIADFLQKGEQQICAGYALYGTSTTLVLTTGQGVNAFTLDEATGDFILTHANISIPNETQSFAINMSNYRYWPKYIQRYIGECMQGQEGPREKDFNIRWAGAMVADVHRLLMQGGVFLYPKDSKNAAQGGRLRLMYEINPIAMIVEQAGGMAVTDVVSVLSMQPQSLHQRCGVLFGASNEIERIQGYYMDALLP